MDKPPKLHSTHKTFFFYLPRNTFLKHSLFFLTALITFILFLQFQAVQYCPFPISWHSFAYTSNQEKLTSMLRDSVTFLPLKDLRFSKEPSTGHTWFMSSVNDTAEPGELQYMYFPSEASKGRLLCLLAHDRSDGAKNSYAFAWPEALPRGATLLPGITYLSDTYYDYSNLWHGLSAVVPFVGWHIKNGCEPPERLVLFHWGELRIEMGKWVKNIADATFGEVKIETFEGIEGPACFEKAAVFRHNQAGMCKARQREVYDMMRCKARVFCKVEIEKKIEDIGMTLLLRTGPRSFKNESAVVEVFRKECSNVERCRIKVAKADNLTFCDQVKLLSETDILVTPHGAQITNIMFMDKNSSIMEFYPKGWEELAGQGQYVFRWFSDWTGMRHQGSWRDQSGESCPDGTDKLHCFFSYKDRQIGHDTTYFSQWAAKVLREVKEYKKSTASEPNKITGQSTGSCQCGSSL